MSDSNFIFEILSFKGHKKKCKVLSNPIPSDQLNEKNWVSSFNKKIQQNASKK